MVKPLRLEDFATDRHPLHCSRIPQFLSCPWKILMEHLGIYNRDGGVGAQTGTVVHKGVQEWHTNGGKEDSAIGVMEAMRGTFPLANYTEAEALFRRYIADPQNQKAKIAVHAGKKLVEVLFHAEVAPDIVLEGTLDQIREEGDTWYVIDLKTSKEPGVKIRDQHTYQIAAYSYLATQRYKRPVLPGGIVMVRGKTAWWPYDLTMSDVNQLMRAVVDRVRDVRAGRLQVVPGEYCDFCVGVTKCISKLRATVEEISDGETSKRSSGD